MAVYKVIQDIEAEDKIVGPLSLKGFVYAAAAGVLAFVSIRLLISGLPWFIKLIFIVAFLPPMLLFGVLASPLGREQPTEVWLLSRIRFLLKPRERIWDQAGTKQLVTITAPKRPEQMLTKNLSQTEVASRLQSLASTLDSRGWAGKNTSINLGAQPSYLDTQVDDDRLSTATVSEAAQPVLDVRPSDDILDEQNNPAAQTMVALVEQKEAERKQALIDQMNATRDETDRQTSVRNKSEAGNELTEDEEKLLNQLHARDAAFSHPQIIRAGATDMPVTGNSQTVKLELAQSGNDLSVASIARLVNRSASSFPGEVEIPL